MLSRRTPIAVLAAATALALSATPALARGGSGSGGGGGGGTVTQPAPTFDPWTLCPDYRDVGSITLADGSTTFANVVADTACVVVRVQPSGGLGLYQLRVAPGWDHTLKSARGRRPHPGRNQLSD